jgi:hypothetical protein
MQTGANGERIQAGADALTTYNRGKMFRFQQEAA